MNHHFFKTFFLLCGLTFSVSSFSGISGQINVSDSEKLHSIKPALTKDQEKAWNLMIGKTYINQSTKTGGRKEILSTLSPYGTYEVLFREYDIDGEYTDTIEFGEWGISGGVYFTIFKGWVSNGKLEKSDPSDPYNRDAYKIITLNKKVFIYQSLVDNTRYVAKRVDDDFTLPTPSKI